VAGGPIYPDAYDGEHLNTDEKLRAAGWAAGLDVWSVLDKTHGDALSDGTVANAQLWSLREAVRAELMAEVGEKLRALAALMDFIGDGEDNVIRNIRDFAAGDGEDDNDPRVEARRYGLEF
jgi:hypothetical protein